MGQIESNFRQFDAALLLDAGTAGAKTASFNASVSSINLGTARVRGEMVVDVSALDVGTGDESYKVVLLGGTEAGFSSGKEEELAVVALGGASTKEGDQVDVAPLRLTVPFDTHRAGQIYSHVRLRVVMSGTTPSVTLGECYLTRSI